MLPSALHLHLCCKELLTWRPEVCSWSWERGMHVASQLAVCVTNSCSCKGYRCPSFSCRWESQRWTKRWKKQFAIKFSPSWSELCWLFALSVQKKKRGALWQWSICYVIRVLQKISVSNSRAGVSVSVVGRLAEGLRSALALSATIGVSARFFQALNLDKFHVIGWLRWFLQVSVWVMAG